MLNMGVLKYLNICTIIISDYSCFILVVIYASWEECVRPSLYGGPLDDEYRFINLRFRWGPNDHEGSEHMVSSTRYAMELQAAFIKCGAADDDIVKAAEGGALVFLSYLFMVNEETH